MKKFLFLLVFTLFFTSTAFAAKSTIVCGDVADGYVTMDLSEAFTSKYLTAELKEEYKKEGYNYLVAGRNCGLGSFTSNIEFEILFLFKGSRAREIIDLGPFTIYSAKINLDLNTEDLRSSDLIMSSEETSTTRKLMSEYDNVSGSLSLSRGSGKVKIIISPIRK